MRKPGTECRERKQKVSESRFGTAPSFCAFVTDTHSPDVNNLRTWRTNIQTCSFIAYSVPKSARILSRPNCFRSSGDTSRVLAGITESLFLPLEVFRITFTADRLAIRCERCEGSSYS